MNFALCHLSVVSLRNSPSDKSEQISQLLFGETAEILERRGNSWLKVRCLWDNCIGWVRSLQLKPLTMSEYELFEERYAYCLDLFQPLLCDDFSIPVTIGSRLPDFDGMKFVLDGKVYFYSGQAVFPENLEPTTDRVLKIARRYLFAPYQWGGRSPFGIDSAGFTQVVFKMVGIHLHRAAEQQVHQGSLVDFIEQSLSGDLAFFENHSGNINHVGILMPENKIMHVAGQARIDRLDHYGIYNEELKRYTYRLRVIKRILKPVPVLPPPKKEEPPVKPQFVLFDQV